MTDALDSRALKLAKEPKDSAIASPGSPTPSVLRRRLAAAVLRAGHVPLAAPDTEDGGTVSREVVDVYAHGDCLDQIAFRLENAIALRLEPVLTFFLLVFLFLLDVRLLRAEVFDTDATAGGGGASTPLRSTAPWTRCSA